MLYKVYWSLVYTGLTVLQTAANDMNQADLNIMLWSTVSHMVLS